LYWESNFGAVMNKIMIEIAHETVKGLYNIGLVDQMTMHEFDALCLPKIKEMFLLHMLYDKVAKRNIEDLIYKKSIG